MRSLVTTLILFLLPLLAAKPTTLEFAKVDNTPLFLDLYLPENEDSPGLIVWVHGGAWRAGSRESVPIRPLLEKGWAIASVDYRLSTQAKFPAQIHDIKAAIRYLRANEESYTYNASKIIIAGASAGGHLAALVGVTNDHPKLEGEIGDRLETSSSVQCTVSFFGASNLTTILKQSTPHGLKVRVPSLDLFLGAQPNDDPETAKLASPVFHVDPSDPPCLLIHGAQDPQMPVNQSLELQGKLEEHSIPHHLEIIYDGKHGGPSFYDAKRITLIDRFLRDRF
ncbi:alpha/beta hydrolase [Pelagicoccus mobilis]|uniref:Alpha/beta hydrolase n=1 Tax=Pelagicoccus mobilis TaxID=415221 RepID=A0A934S2I9_9BACT|nr:alpha/beta hydrolase [Pelagicoccus mobilis]MBK1878244.1 alpha/beta hydrolase [Pelagicoccus mobilis]